MRHFTEELDQLNISDSMNDMVVIEGFMDRYDVSFDEAEEILCETKKFLALAADCENGDGLFIDKPLQILDEMWDTFILHTNQYVPT